MACTVQSLYFINPGELHSISTEKNGSSGEDAVVFSLDILSFDSCDAAQMQLINPIQNGKMLFPEVFHRRAADGFLEKPAENLLKWTFWAYVHSSPSPVSNLILSDKTDSRPH